MLFSLFCYVLHDFSVFLHLPVKKNLSVFSVCFSPFCAIKTKNVQKQRIRSWNFHFFKCFWPITCFSFFLAILLCFAWYQVLLQMWCWCMINVKQERFHWKLYLLLLFPHSSVISHVLHGFLLSFSLFSITFCVFLHIFRKWSHSA